MSIDIEKLDLIPYFIESLKAFIIVSLVYLSFYRLSSSLDPNKDASIYRWIERLAFTIALCLTPVIRWIYVIFIIITNTSILLPSVQTSIKEKFKEIEESKNR